MPGYAYPPYIEPLVKKVDTMCFPHLMTPKSNSSRIEQDQCPFTIQQLTPSIYVIRENDVFREHPHIYAKLCRKSNDDGTSESVIVLGDTGVGTKYQSKTGLWTIKSFLESTINKDSKMPYVIILSHCHFDHILGLQYLNPSESLYATPDITIVSSGRDPSFTTPYNELNKNSHCKYIGVPAPEYKTNIWARDRQDLVHTDVNGSIMHLGITLLHTPGHTPDSLSWYDVHDRILFVGDSFYYRTSAYTQNAPWGPEAPAAIFFPLEGNLYDWWNSVNKLLRFVEYENKQEPAVKVAAGHVTTLVDAHECLTDMKHFVARILRGDINCEEMPDVRGHPMGHWVNRNERPIKISVMAPISLIEKGRVAIEKTMTC